MKIAFLINQMHIEKAHFTTTILAYEAYLRGHEIYYIGLADFVYAEHNEVQANVRSINPAELQFATKEEMLAHLYSCKKEKLSMHNIDVLWIRHDPVLDMISRPWAAAMGLQFAQLIKKMGKLVINDPDTLNDASNKLYLENFHPSVRPKTLVTCNAEDIKQFLFDNGGKIIVKPLKGSGGKNVFLITQNDLHNLKQIVEAISRDGYVIAQEYLPEAVKGDLRFFLLDGKPLIKNGKYAAVQRVQQAGEIRSNIHQGGEPQAAVITDTTLDIIEKVGKQLQEDAMYFVGLDIVGDKILEINIFSPGALVMACNLTGEDFITYILEDIERKVESFYQ